MNSPPQSRPAPTATLFGIPLGDLGWFASLLMATALGFAAFFAATFLGIVSLLLYNTAAHSAVDYSLAYRRIGFPIGILVLTTAYAVLGTLWFKRQFRRA